MTFADRLVLWNRFYDSMPPEWRFQFLLWPILIVGTLNMLLTISVHFPFGLLLILAIACVVAVRVPYALNSSRAARVDGDQPPVMGAGSAWLLDINRRYEALPDARRTWVFPGILIAAGTINMWLTIASGFPFGLLFLLAILVLVVIRAPYIYGWLGDQAVSPPPEIELASPAPALPAQEMVVPEQQPE